VEFFRGKTVIHPKGPVADEWIAMIEKEKEEEQRKEERTLERDREDESRLEDEKGH
jgi:hypothetical protein